MGRRIASGSQCEVLPAIGSKPAFYRFEGLGDPTANWPPEPAERRSYDEDVVVGLNEEAGDYAPFNHNKLSPAGALAIPSIAYRLALAAAGEVDASVSLTGGLDPYDVAGGRALLAAVGGTLVELDGTPIDCGFGHSASIERKIFRRRDSQFRTHPSTRLSRTQTPLSSS